MADYLIFSLITVWLTVLGWYDCCYRRLPNYLTLGGAAVFLVIRLAIGGIHGPDGILFGLLGGVIGGVFLLLPFLLRGAGAGDMKMFFAVGCWIGFPDIIVIMILSTVLGLILGFVMILCGKLDSARLKHLWYCCVKLNYDRAQGRKNLPPKEKETVRIPFGVAIAVGTWIGLVVDGFVR